MDYKFKVSDARHMQWPYFPSAHSGLTVFESGKEVPFDIARVFAITATAETKRGHHAHRRCTQLLVCLSGSCEITLDDSRTTITTRLTTPSTGLLVPPGLWLQLLFPDTTTTLLVFCDRPYEPIDYIRDYEDFLQYAKTDVLDDDV